MRMMVTIDDDECNVKAQSCDLHHCQLLIGRLHQLTTIDDADDVPDPTSSCTYM